MGEENKKRERPPKEKPDPIRIHMESYPQQPDQLNFSTEKPKEKPSKKESSDK